MPSFAGKIQIFPQITFHINTPTSMQRIRIPCSKSNIHRVLNTHQRKTLLYRHFCTHVPKPSTKGSTPDQPSHPLHAFASSTSQQQHHSTHQSIEDAIRRSIRGHSYTILSTIATAILGVVLFTFLGREQIRDAFTKETAGVATRSLENKDVVARAERTTKELLQHILVDEELMGKVQMSLIDMSRGVVNDEMIRRDVQNLLLQVTLNILREDSTAVVFKDLVVMALQDQETIEAVVQIFFHIFRDPVVQERTAEFVSEVLTMEAVKDQTSRLSLGVAEIILEDERVSRLSKELVEEVLGDQHVQKSGSDALWNVVLGSIWGSKTPVQEVHTAKVPENRNQVEITLNEDNPPSSLPSEDGESVDPASFV